MKYCRNCGNSGEKEGCRKCMNFRMTFGSVKRSMSRQEAALVKGQNETRIR